MATRSEGQEPDPPSAEPVFSPLDFRLNLQARLAGSAEPVEPLTNLDSPSIRKLTWEHVVPGRPEEPTPNVAASTPATVPLPPPARVAAPPPPLPPQLLEPPVSAVTAAPAIEAAVVPAVVVDEVVAGPVAEIAEVAGLEVSVVEHIADDIDDVDDVVAEQDEVPEVQVVAATSSSEINRLASVPDLIIDDSPIELPPINPSGGQIVAQPVIVYTPILPETVLVAAPRPVTTTVATIVAESRPARRQSVRKPKKGHPFRSFVGLMLLLGLLGGGAFAAQKYLLHKNEPKWSAEMEPFATDVATARGLQFKSAVVVEPLAVDVYAGRLAGSVITAKPGRAEAWRSLGLLNGELDLAAIGTQAMNDSPAFYDPTTTTIYVSDDLSEYQHLYRFALRRALATALLDQQFDWSSRLATATPAGAVALRATIDGDALAVANSLAENDTPDQLAPELFAFVQSHAVTVAPSQYAATIAGRAGVALRPTIAAMTGLPDTRAVLEQATPSGDAVFDAIRTTTPVASAPNSQGMMFWYYVLASRIDDTQAWSAALRWTSDSLVEATGSAPQCFDATVSAADADGAAVLLAAFGSWAAAAPVESTTTVAPIDGNQVAIRTCDPGAAVTALLPVKVPVVYGGAGVERALVQSATSATSATSAAGQATVDATCLITAARQRGTVLTSPADDPPVLAVDWQPAYVAANLDLATGCVAASG